MNLDDFFAGPRERVRVEAYIGAPEYGGVVNAMVELLSFWVADEEFAVEINHIQEIIKLPHITHIPRAKPAVLGVMSLRGTIVPVVDLRRVLKLDVRAPTRLSRVLVLRVDNHPLGLLVDRVTSVVRFERDVIEPKPRGIRRETVEFLQGVGRVGDRLLIVLDVPTLLTSLDTLA